MRRMAGRGSGGGGSGGIPYIYWRSPMEQVQAGTAFRPGGKATAALFSVFVNLVLIAGKLAVGLLTGSVAILADAAHSFLDLSASIFAFAGSRAAAKPADEHHAWGHAKAENI